MLPRLRMALLALVNKFQPMSVEEYLGQATDLHDLEARIAQVDRGEWPGASRQGVGR